MQLLRDQKNELLAGQLFALTTHLSQRSESRAVSLAAEYDLTLSQLRALLVLWRAEQPLSLGELADAVGLSDAAAVRMVDGLLRGDLAVRREDEHDRRIKRITLSEAGSEALNNLAEAKRESLEALTAGLLPEEVERLSAALDPIIARLGLTSDLPRRR